MPEVTPAGIEKFFHKLEACIGPNCVVHNPSDHHMKWWPINIRVDREFGLAERICPHGIGHPDPDALAFIRAKVAELMESSPYSTGWGRYRGSPYGPYASEIHGCDGCCRP